mgnify:CR=1 FL=1
MNSRFGLNLTKGISLEEGIRWAGDNGFGYVDFQADLAPNNLASFDADRVGEVQALCDRHGVQIGIHPSSAVNNAEYVPILSRAVDDYLKANLDLAKQLGCGWIVGHGGYHFGDVAPGRQAAVDRMKRLVDQAEKARVMVYFENHNKEPEHAEVHYIPHTVEETHWFLDKIQSDYLKWSFNVAHGHLVPEGWAGFLDAFGVDNLGQVRLNDNNGDYEVHLVPGEGTIDFEALFARLNTMGYDGWFSLGFGSNEDKVRVKDWFEGLL